LLLCNNDLIEITKPDAHNLNLRFENNGAPTYIALCAMQQSQKGRSTMRTTYPLYEGDGYLHFRATPASARKPELSGADIRAIEARARALRREAVSALLARFGQWLEAKLRPGVRRDVEAYLAQSTDHADLERRLRDVERKNQLGYC
jgi:uncharacterized protein DUF3563